MTLTTPYSVHFAAREKMKNSDVAIAITAVPSSWCYTSRLLSSALFSSIHGRISRCSKQCTMAILRQFPVPRFSPQLFEHHRQGGNDKLLAKDRAKVMKHGQDELSLVDEDTSHNSLVTTAMEENALRGCARRDLRVSSGYYYLSIAVASDKCKLVGSLPCCVVIDATFSRRTRIVFIPVSFMEHNAENELTDE
ncbi:hypothetical protein ARMGADRAFT_122914 [Armillaria gallica]|uniref:Uncharacterized protein n=1 Tax=Armillaria gallica TaxID=47427 RepID=A0A2H3DR81_ARMGA|nr:hypothetical protein ARMGADRAFT_122914 [Armillaria gallica]